MDNNTTTLPPGGQTLPVGDLQGQTPTNQAPQGQTPPGEQQNQQQQQQHTRSISEWPEEAQAVIRELRNEAKTLRKQIEGDAARKQAEAEQQLAEQGQYKQLAEAHASRVKELEPIAAAYSALAEQLAENIRVETKDWPPSVKALDPGKDAPIEQRLAWMAKSKAIITELAAQARGQQPGNAANPPPVTSAQQSQTAVEELRSRAAARYGRIF